jgi:uncharacterized protein
MTRTDITFLSGADRCAGWLYPPTGAGRERPPIVVLGHGIGGVKEMRLDAYAERFQQAGYACLVFDYRHFGASGGEPRQLLDVATELGDWRAAVAYARELDDVDTSRIALFGSSFGGGLVIDVAAHDGDIAAVISQCPFTDGLASARASGPISTARVTALAVADLAAAMFGRAPVTAALAGPPRSAALMTAPDCAPGYLALTDVAPSFRNEVCARFVFEIARYFPGRRASKVNCPILFALCRDDSVAPARASRTHANRAPRAEIREYPVGHFDVYLGEPFERVVDDYVDFLHRHLPVG